MGNIPIMQIWTSPAWPNFRHDSTRTEHKLARVMARLGAVEGMHTGLMIEERREVFLRAVTGEALLWLPPVVQEVFDPFDA